MSALLIFYAAKLKASELQCVCLSIRVCVCVCVRESVRFMSAPKWNAFACMCCHANSCTMLSILKQCNGWKHARCVYAHTHESVSLYANTVSEH